MEIYIVKSGDTLSRVARDYEVDIKNLAADNGLSADSDLVVGQALIILVPEVVHTVRRGETLTSIAKSYGITALQILRNNMRLGGRDRVTVGEELVIRYRDENKRRSFSVNSYAYPYIETSLLRKQMPYLTYLTPFTYGIGNDGSLIMPDDRELIRVSGEYGVKNLLHLSTLTEEGGFSSERASLVFNNSALRERLIDEMIMTVRGKGFYGIDIDFEFINPAESYEYVMFLQEVRLRLEPLGMPLFSALAPKTSDTQRGVLYEGHNYGGIGAAVNYVLLMTYEWGYTYGPPMAIAPLPSVRNVVEYGLTRVSSSKIYLGIPTYGYDWTLPYVKDSGIGAPSISPVEAVDIARRYRADIRFDETAKAPWFIYTDDDGRLHEVWFEDVRSIGYKLNLAEEFDLFGLGYWNSMRDFPQNWVYLNANYNIENISLT